MPYLATSRFSVQFFGVLGVFFLCGIAYGQFASGGPYPRPMTAGEARDFAYLLPKLKSGQAYVLNLAEPHQRSIAMRGLMLANRTPRNAPQTHAALRAAVRSQLQQTKGRENDPGALAPQPLKAATPGGTQDIAAISNFAEEGQGLYTASGYSSVYGGTSQTTIEMKLFDTRTQMIYAVATGTQYAQGTDYQVSVMGPVESAADLAAIATITTTVGAESTTVVVSTAAMVPTSAATMTAPNYCKRTVADNPSSDCVIDKGQTQYQTTSTTLVPSPGAIKICFARGSQQSCDYYNNNFPTATSVFFPAAGTAAFGTSSIDAATYASAGKYTATIVDPVIGGGCVFADRADLKGAGWSLPSANTVQWNLPQLSLTNPTDCLKRSGGRRVNFTFYVEVPLINSKPGFVSFTSAYSPPAPRGYYGIPPLYLEDSCVAAGTLVRLADGSEAAIETLSADQSPSVRTATGEARTVLGTARGVELRPMIRLRTSLGQNLLLTRTHPVLTVYGLVMAQDLKAGERVRTEKGVAAIVSTATERYTGQVHSLRLGWFDEAKTDRRTHSANGIFIGDSVTQQQLEQEEVARLQGDRTQVMRRLPNDKWRAEYKTFLAQQR